MSSKTDRVKYSYSKSLPMDLQAASLWAKTKLDSWPENYLIVDLHVSLYAEVIQSLSQIEESFCALVFEPDQISLTVNEHVWYSSALSVVLCPMQ